MIDDQTALRCAQLPSAFAQYAIRTPARRSPEEHREHAWARRNFPRDTTAAGGYRGRVLYELDTVIDRRLDASQPAAT